jgi:hypothetical protein
MMGFVKKGVAAMALSMLLISLTSSVAVAQLRDEPVDYGQVDDAQITGTDNFVVPSDWPVVLDVPPATPWAAVVIGMIISSLISLCITKRYVLARMV